MVDESGGKLEKFKDGFREKVKTMLDSFLKEVTVASEDFFKAAPYSFDRVTTHEALGSISASKTLLESLRVRSLELKSGMDIFNIPQPPYKEFVAMDKDLDLLERIWTLVEEWQGLYSVWKDGAFVDIRVEEMEEAAVRIGKNVQKMGRDIKSWGVWVSIKDTVDSFKKTMPLITDLRNPAMRSRHWEQLMEEIGSKFDPTSSSFTLDTILTLRLDTKVEFIAELSTNATKELAIETNLKSITATWATLGIDMVEYKQTFKLRSTEEVRMGESERGACSSD